ncbi:MAG: protein phosphatase 2C domain-containing protein [Labilithrix sp.]|nr:protein phosphatase 2C domain-containing protein [Labilithrix sp.]
MSTSSKIPSVETAVRTDPGRDPDKQVNEDASVEKETPLGLLAVVCDGMGGHAGGKEASELAIKTIVEIVEAAPPATTAGVALARAIEEANARIWSMPTLEAGYRPGSTVVAVLAHEGGVEVAHVGDSRLYLVHAGTISQVTRDHSMVQEMVDRNLIRAEDAAKHPDANKILRALGIAKDVDVELRAEPIAYVAGDVLILCSDGLSDLVEPAEILEIAGSHPPLQAAGQLVDLANARGGHDNITAMVIRMKASAVVREGDRARQKLPKTIPLTAHAAPDPGAGPTGTVVSAPMAPPPGAATTVAAPAVGAASGPGAPPPQESGPSAAIPPAPRVREGGEGGRSRTLILVVGIVLAVVAVGIVVAIVTVALRPKPHHTVPLIEDAPPDASVAVLEDDAGEDPPEPTVEPAPTLTAEPTAKPGKGRDGGHRDPCEAAQHARETGAAESVITRLEERCRASGGSL